VRLATPVGEVRVTVHNDRDHDGAQLDERLAEWPADCSVPLRDETIGDVLRAAAADAPEVLALVDAVADPALRRTWTFAELLAEAETVAAVLLTRFEPGERLAVWAANCPEWVHLQYGAALAGLVLVTVNPAAAGPEVRYLLEQSRSVGVVAANDFRGRNLAAEVRSIRDELPSLRDVIDLAGWDDFVGPLDGVPELPAVDPHGPAMVLYTSGTTGAPKGAVLSHRGIANNSRFIVARQGFGRGECLVSAMPMFHAGGCIMGSVGLVHHRVTSIRMRAFDAGLALKLIETYRAAGWGGVPTMLQAAMEHPDFASRDTSSLRTITSGGAPVPDALVARVEAAFGASMMIVYGQTECTNVVTQTFLDDPIDAKGSSVGAVLPHAELRIADPVTGTTCRFGEIGEILIRGYQVMLGYHDAPDATAATIDSNGWLHTGDLGALDTNGRLRIEGRVKDMIIRGGENIYAREVEDVLLTHPAVAEVAVVGVPSERWGEEVAAFVRTTAAVDADELARHAVDALARFKVPVHWAFVESYPLTASGKVRKVELREQFVEGRVAPIRTGRVAS
jgi:fatty-acyl-CoA synthase